jgi:DNA-3-methyladenine glycosylase II
LTQETNTKVLTKASFSKALTLLSRQDPDLLHVIDTFGKPPLRFREPGFKALVQIILEQQVSLASAKAAFDRLIETLTLLDPSSFLSLDDLELRRIGFSRQKARYCRQLALAIGSGEIDLVSLETMDDDSARNELTKLIGIGSWTAEIYLIVSLHRADIWPAGDIALASSLQKLKNLDHRPNFLEMSEIGDSWRPWRTVAAKILWHYYVSS